jgi:transcriptional regulator with PAS, ATPase and Fis domain
MKILVCWIGNADLKAADGDARSGAGPIAQVVAQGEFDRIVLLCDYDKAKLTAYCAWLRKQTQIPIESKQHKLTGPTDFGEIYEAAVAELSALTQKFGSKLELTFHLSPGTPAMAAVWIILAKTRFPATLVESSQMHGMRIASVPFDMSAEFIPDLLRRPDENLERMAQGLFDPAPGFENIIHRSLEMKRVIALARRVAARSIPVLIEGESGTGKELMARAIHKSSPRREKPFIAINCGAIPPELVESEFFGHEKGSFTGASAKREGHFEKAEGGTLFLDEIGELPKAVQVKLLRALQEKEIIRVGASTPTRINVRIVAATNRSLASEVARGEFREDLFFRLAVAVIKLPPLRERSGDVSLIVDRMLEQINEEACLEPGFKHKKLSVSAKNLLINHSWPGNVRELVNTLQRAMIWSDEDTIGTEAIKDAILDLGNGRQAIDPILGRQLGEGFDLDAIMAEVARHYLTMALAESHGVKTRAASLLGLSSYQTLSNWMEKYGVSA